jgi:hypothetical protein
MGAMYASKLAAILVAAAGFSALAGTAAQAQISGSIGGDVVARNPVPGLGATSPLTPPTAAWTPGGHG